MHRTACVTCIAPDASRTLTTTQTRRSAAGSRSRLKIIQEQAGHEYASTTSIYTCVSSDYRTKTLRQALDKTMSFGHGQRRGCAVRRQVGYRWRLREVMASRGLFATTQLSPLLAERGIELSASQVHRLVTGTPERLSLQVLAALCDILEVTPDELIPVTAANAQPRKTASAGLAPASADPGLRPKRVRLRPAP
jgi:DNA-binding Xre family transcriptional regulator